MKNDVINRFFAYHEINPEIISKRVDTKVYKKEYFMGTLSKSLIYKPSVEKEISIADIYGYDFKTDREDDTVFTLLGDYYKDEPKQKITLFKKRDEHINRSNDNLMLSSTQMIEKSNSLDDLITVNCVDRASNINLIYTNGMHRFLALKALYLKEVSEHPEKSSEIKNRYKIKVRYSEIDEIKTYCFFILNRYFKKLNQRAGFKPEIKDYKNSGKIMIGIFDGNKLIKEYVFNDEELINFVRPMIESDLEYLKTINVPGFVSFLNSLGYDIVDEYKMR